ncbi:MAG: sensor hybrid histidine kinase, partial [Verrucomicrobiales bacterium]|nr:sensor hybrid histidine kinase [Verrucomicrobiales bacterium]
MANELRIVLIDDNPNDRLLIKRALEKEFGKLLFSEINEPREFAWNLETRFDLVITDYSLGWSDGLSILRTVKSRYPEVPVIMYTGSGNEEIAVKGLKEGLADYILKSPKAEESLVKMARAALLRANAAANEKRSELNLRRLLSRLQFATFRTDGNGVFLAWNEVFGNLFALGSGGRQATLQTLFCESGQYQDLLRKLFEDDGVLQVDSIKL